MTSYLNYKRKSGSFIHSHKSMANFRLDTKFIFLTYPKCPIPREDMLRHLELKLRRFTPTYIGISQELHADGTEHLHCLIQLTKRCCIRRCEFFDLLDYHPNVQAARDSLKVYEYISKIQKPLEIGVLIKHRTETYRRNCKKRVADGWRDIIETAQSKEEYIEMVKTQFPDVFATRLNNIQYSADFLFPTVQPDYISPFDLQSFNPPSEAKKYADDYIFKVNKYSYELLHPHCNSDSDLKWMEDLTLEFHSRKSHREQGRCHYTFVDPQELEKLLGHDPWEPITTGTVLSTSQHTTTKHDTMSSMTSTSNSAHYGNN